VNLICEDLNLLIMFSTNDIAKIYDTVLSIPGMNENVKVDLRMPRKNVLLLSKVIERGLTVKDKDQPGNVLNSIDEATIAQLSTVATELLNKAGLTEMNEKLNALK